MIKLLFKPLLNNRGIVEKIFTLLSGGILPFAAREGRRMLDKRPSNADPLLPSDPGYTEFSFLNPMTWGGYHDETSMWKSDAENQAIADAKMQRDLQKAGLDKRGRESGLADIAKAISSFQDVIDADRERQQERYEEFKGEWDKLSASEKKNISADRAFWQQKRDRALSDWRTDRANITDYWTGARDFNQRQLRDIQQQQLNLAQELKEAPSSVAEQARIEADKALSQSVALAGAMGGGVGANYGALADRARGMQGDVISRTAGLRSAEHAQRIAQRAGLLGQAGLTSGQLIGLGQADAGIMSDVAKSNVNLLTGLGSQNVNIGTALQGRKESLLRSLLGGMGFGQSGDVSLRKSASMIPGWTSSVEGTQYGRNLQAFNMMMQNRERERQLIEENTQKWISGIGTIASLVTGGAGGGAVSGGIGALSGLLSGGGSQMVPQTPMFSRQPNLQTRSGWTTADFA